MGFQALLNRCRKKGKKNLRNIAVSLQEVKEVDDDYIDKLIERGAPDHVIKAAKEEIKNSIVYVWDSNKMSMQLFALLDWDYRQVTREIINNGKKSYYTEEVKWRINRPSLQATIWFLGRDFIKKKTELFSDMLVMQQAVISEIE